MPKRLLDSTFLIAHLQRMSPLAGKGADDARNWAKRLIDIKGTNAMVSPVVIEVLAGVRDSHELALIEAFLEEIEVVDEGTTPPQDWGWPDTSPSELSSTIVRYLGETGGETASSARIHEHGTSGIA